MLIKKAVLRIGLANLVSTLSFLTSLTALVIVARLSSEYTHSKLSSTAPIVINSKTPTFEDVKNPNDTRSEGYEHILQEASTDQRDRSSDFNRNNVQHTENTIRTQNAKTQSNANISDSLSDIDIFEMGIERVSAQNTIENSTAPVKQKKVKITLPIRAPKHIKNNGADIHAQNITTYNSSPQGSKTSMFETINGKIVKIEPGHKNDFKKVQIDTFETHSDAIAGWFRMKKEHHATLNPHRYSIDTVTNDYGKKLFRLYIETKNEDEAKLLCKSFRAKKINCVVVQ